MIPRRCPCGRAILTVQADLCRLCREQARNARRNALRRQQPPEVRCDPVSPFTRYRRLEVLFAAQRAEKDRTRWVGSRWTPRLNHSP